MDPTSLNQASNDFFLIFLSLDHRFYLKLNTMIACNNVEHLVEVTSTNKSLGAQIYTKRAKTGPKIKFFAYFSSLVH